MQLRRYDPSLAPAWNGFIALAENATFMFHRDFMGYHADRFADHSLLIFDQDELVAVFPANEVGREIWSHQGLSYGGLVIYPSLAPADRLACLRLVVAHCQKAGFAKLIYKSLPSFYWATSGAAAQEAQWLGELGATLVRQDRNTIVDLGQPLHFQVRRRRGSKKAERAGVLLGPSDDYAGFWQQILVPTLHTRHGIAPVHTPREMARLAHCFPQHISLQVAQYQGQPVAGTVIFVHGQVVHAQYIAASPLGRELGALDLLFAHLLAQYATTHRWFSFGISTYDSGRQLNQGLYDWKMGFGGQDCPHLTYQLDFTGT
jgi:Acetyltransferase (GNAT) domain